MTPRTGAPSLSCRGQQRCRTAAGPSLTPIDARLLLRAGDDRGRREAVAEVSRPDYRFTEGTLVASPDAITVTQLSRLVGTPDAPLILDVRTDEDLAADTRLLPASVRRDHRCVSSWVGEFAGRSVAVVCRCGLAGRCGRLAAPRRREPVPEGGLEAWIEARWTAIRPTNIQRARGRTVWVTRARPKLTACVPLADPPLRRSVGRVSIRRTHRGHAVASRVQRNTVRHGGRLLEPSRKDLLTHLAPPWPAPRRAPSAGRHCARRGYRRA